MIDALLLAVRDAVLASVYGWDYRSAAIMEDGHPEPRCGDWFLAIHGLGVTSEMDNALDEYYGFGLTLTRRLAGVPFDRVGDKIIVTNVRNFAQETGFNARCDQLRALFHMNWPVLGAANTYLTTLQCQKPAVYGFSEPARYRGREDPPVGVGPEWFEADPDGDPKVGIKSELRFEGCRRLQAISFFV